MRIDPKRWVCKAASAIAYATILLKLLPNSLMTYPLTYYAGSADFLPQQERLMESVDTDVCVVGGGIAGCSAALHLAERGLKVVLLEGERIGWGASGRSGGQALVGYACDQRRLALQVGPTAARTMWDISVEALELLKERVARHNIDCALQLGHLHAAIRPRHRASLMRWHDELVASYGYRTTRFIDRDEIRGLLATDRYIAGVLDTASAHLHPLNYTLGLARAAQRAGVRIFESSPALRLRQGPIAVTCTQNGRINSRYVILCCNAYLNGLCPRIGSHIMPVETYIIATEPLGPVGAAELIKGNIAVADVNFVLDYFRLSADHRLLFGGRVAYSGMEFRDTAKATRKRMLQVFPQLANTKIDYAWGGYVDITMSRAPDFGRAAANVYYLQGFSGHGVALAGMAGKLAAEAISGQAERFDLYAQLKHAPFFGGRWLRTPALMLAMLWYRLRDLL